MSYHLDKNRTKNDSSIRIIKRNLVYVIGLDPKIANKDILMKREFLGQYGRITRLIVNNSKAYTPSNSSTGPSYSAYINFSSEQEAALAILSVDSSTYNSKQIKAAFGTTKYCAFYVKKVSCPNKDCVYIHTVQDKSNIISKESSDFYIEQHKIAVKVSDIGNPKFRDLLYKNRHEETVFPNPYTVYFKKSIISQLKADGSLEVSNSYTQHSRHSNSTSTNTTSANYSSVTSNSRAYNASNNKKQGNKGLSGYFENSGDDYYMTKTVIKEINYDDKKRDSRDGSPESSNNKEGEDKEGESYSRKRSQEIAEPMEADEEDILKELKEFTEGEMKSINYSNSQSKSRKQSEVSRDRSRENGPDKSNPYSRDEKCTSPEPEPNNDINCNSNSNSHSNSNSKEDRKEDNSNIIYKPNNSKANNKDLEASEKNSQMSTRVNSKTALSEQNKVNNNYCLFKLEKKSKFDFAANNLESDTTSKNKESTKAPNEINSEEEHHQSKFLQQYYMRFTFSNLVKTSSKESIEEDYFSKLRDNITS